MVIPGNADMPVEPCAVARMARNGWTAKRIGDLLGMHPLAVGQRLRDADREEQGVDRKLIVNTRLRNV
jgi:hypothetical protein